MEEIRGSAGGGAAFRRDWTQGSVIGNLLLLSWPMIVTNGLWMVGMLVDMIWVGKLGAASIAGVGIASAVFLLVMTAKLGLITGVRAMIARFIGAGDAEGANHVARQGLIISVVYGAVMTVIGVPLAEPILNLFGLEADVVAEGAAFLGIMFTGWVPMSFWLMAYSSMQASGDTVTPMKIAVLFRIVHVVLCPFLVFGWWVFPSLGVSGAALANVIAQSLGTALALWVLFTGRSRLRLTLRNFRLDLNIIWRIVKIGIPASVMGVQRSFGHLVLVWLMVPFGTLAVAAHSLVQRVEMILFQPSFSISVAAGVLVGQNLGASQPGRAERGGWLATGFVQLIMFAGSVAILPWAENIIRIFNTEPGLVELSSIFLRIAVAGYLLLSFSVVLPQAIGSAGDTLPTMLFSVVMIWVVQLPLAFLLPQVTNLGVYGVRWAIVAGMVVGAVIYAIYFRLGRWKRKKV